MFQQNPAPAPERRILRRAEVEAKTGFKRAHIYSLMKEGKFPEGHATWRSRRGLGFRRDRPMDHRPP